MKNNKVETNFYLLKINRLDLKNINNFLFLLQSSIFSGSITICLHKPYKNFPTSSSIVKNLLRIFIRRAFQFKTERIKSMVSQPYEIYYLHAVQLTRRK